MEESDQDSVEIINITFMCSEGETKSSGDGKEEKRGDKRITRKDLLEECIRVCRLFSIKWSNSLNFLLSRDRIHGMFIFQSNKIGLGC